MKEERLRFAGDIMSTNADTIVCALSILHYAVRKKSDEEVFVEDDILDMEIYWNQDSDVSKYDFLVSGKINSTKAEAEGRLRTIAACLAKNHIRYNLELHSANASEDDVIIRSSTL